MEFSKLPFDVIGSLVWQYANKHATIQFYSYYSGEWEDMKKSYFSRWILDQVNQLVPDDGSDLIVETTAITDYYIHL
jgi:hypothetical protein